MKNIIPNLKERVETNRKLISNINRKKIVNKTLSK